MLVRGTFRRCSQEVQLPDEMVQAWKEHGLLVSGLQYHSQAVHLTRTVCCCTLNYLEHFETISRKDLA